MQVISSEDINLGKQLLGDLSVEVIAEKLEVSIYDLAYAILDCDFTIPKSVFKLRLARGTIRFEDGAIEKYCVRCKDFYPFIETFWHPIKSKNDGAHSMCRACELARKSDMRKARKLKQTKGEQ